MSAESAKALFHRAVQAFGAGRTSEAEQYFHRALAAEPDNPDVPVNIGVFLMSVGAHDAAKQVLLGATSRFPENAAAWNHLGGSLAAAGRSADAIGHFRRSLAIDPAFTPAQLNLVRALWLGHQLDEAELIARQLVAREPENAEAHFQLGVLRFNLGDAPEAIACHEKCLSLRPDHAFAHHSLLFGLLFDATIGWEELVRRHVNWGDNFSRSLEPMQLHGHRRKLRRLRVGYVSPFIDQHVNSELIEPILAQHDREQFELFAYCTAPPASRTHAPIRGVVQHWRECGSLDDETMAAAIRADEIDLLVDLNLHMAHHRLGVFARRAAPVQINYLAYPATCGLPAMDYRVTCPQLDPPASSESREPEKRLYLPDTFWCYPTSHAVTIGPLPCESAGHVTFGSMNAYLKVQAPAIQVWSKILKRVANSRLAVLVLGGQATRSVLARFASHDIDPAHITLLDNIPHKQHLARYNQIDVCLDTFPYGGHTTTHDAIWMGVPMIALAGSTPISRASKCILSQVGLGDLVADSLEQYVELAVAIANDISRRRLLRQNLRQTMLASPLTDATRFTRQLESTYRAAWRRFCDGLPPADLYADA